MWRWCSAEKKENYGKGRRMQGAVIINWSRCLQLIPWLAYSALKSKVYVFSSMKLPQTGMLGLSVIKQGLPYSGGYSTCVFQLQRELFHSGGTWERSSSLPTGFYAWQRGYLGKACLTSFWFLSQRCTELWDFPGVLQSISGFLIQVSDFSIS